MTDNVFVFLMIYPEQHALLQTVVEACMKKRHCKFTTTPGTSKETAVVVPPSPSCPGQPPKFVEVAYKCRPLEFRSKIICENETIQLNANGTRALPSTRPRSGVYNSKAPSASSRPESTTRVSYYIFLHHVPAKIRRQTNPRNISQSCFLPV